MSAGGVRICLWGQFGSGNFGNDASLEAMLGFLRRAAPDARITCVCFSPERAARDYGIETAPMAWAGGGKAFMLINRLFLRVPDKILGLWDAYRRARTFDVLIVPGTGILDDFDTRPMGLPFDTFRWFIGARLAGAKVALVSIGAGPIRHKLSRFFMKAAARAAHYRSYRDQYSKDYLAGLGLNTRADPVFPDLAFSLPRPASAPAGAKKIIGVGVMDYAGWSARDANAEAVYETYIAKLSRFVAWLLAEGYGVRLILGQDEDARAMADVAKAIGAHTDLAARPAASMRDVLEQIAMCDAVVATRFHNVVAALKVGKPAVSLSYSAKNDALLDSMGMAGFHQHVEAFDEEKLRTQFNTMMTELEARRGAIAAALARVEEALANQENLLLAGPLKFRKTSGG
ncbi:MAG: polysaccharide pyruvyl transferase family protein [Hyphomonadaceae bacterium]